MALKNGKTHLLQMAGLEFYFDFTMHFEFALYWIKKSLNLYLHIPNIWQQIDTWLYCVCNHHSSHRDGNKRLIAYDILILYVMNNEIPYMLVSNSSVLDSLAEMFRSIIMSLGCQCGMQWWRKTSNMFNCHHVRVTWFQELIQHCKYLWVEHLEATNAIHHPFQSL